MTTPPFLESLLKVCAEHTIKDDDLGVKQQYELVWPEPYVPWFDQSPKPALLVLAESQNLSKTNQPYVDRFSAQPSERRYRRLLRDDDGDIGIEPWDNGTLKLARRVIKPNEQIAVSNAIPWSWREKKSGANARPFSAKVEKRAARFWDDIFEKWRPQHIIAAGAVAKGVLKRTEFDQASITHLVLPSPRWNGAATMFEPDHLLDAFPEARKVMESDFAKRIIEKLAEDRQKETVPIRHRLTFFVCHAASRAKKTPPQADK